MKRIRLFQFKLMLISGFFIFVTTPEIKAQGKFVDNEGLAGRISNSVHQKIDRRYNTMANIVASLSPRATSILYRQALPRKFV